MTARKKFIIVLLLFQVAGSVLIAGISIGYFTHALQQVLAASENPILVIMQQRVITKYIVTFAAIAIVITMLTVPAGIILSRILVAPYLRVLQRFSTLAHTRLHGKDLSGVDKNERLLLEKYAMTLYTDMQRYNDFEKAKSWKDGARLLIHELKNPLTPLKLSAQQLMISSVMEGNDEVKRILVSLQDIENILGMFKNLVNIEFGTKTRMNILPEIVSLLQQVQSAGLVFSLRNNIVRQEFTTQFEPKLVKLLLINLIKNSIEENPSGCEVRLYESGSGLGLDVGTCGRFIKEPSRVFKAGYSTKGTNRGFGLFLSQLVSDYLDLGICCRNAPSGAIFSIRFSTSPQSFTREEPI